MIIAHLTYDKRSLLTCCLTRRSWYFAAAPHLHHTLITHVCPPRGGKGVWWWAESFRDMQKLGLFPLVKKLQILGFHFPISSNRYTPFSPELFDPHTLYQFSSLINIQELRIDNLDIPGFVPKIGQYFHHFLPTVQSLALGYPRGSRRQIIFFIGLFRHLQDLKLMSVPDRSRNEPPDDLTLIPTFTPPLRGRLVIRSFGWVGLLEGMVGLLGGFRFRHVDLMGVDGMQLLLDACAETLETFLFNPYDLLSKGVSLKGVHVITKNPSDKPFDLSQNRSLRALEVAMGSMRLVVKTSPLAITSTLKHAFSTITSPAFSEVTVFYRELDFQLPDPFGLHEPPAPAPFYSSLKTPEHRPVFAMLHKMREVRNFNVVLCVDVHARLMAYAVQSLKREARWEEWGSDAVSSRPLMTCSPRGLLSAYDGVYYPPPLEWLRPWAPEPW